MTTFFGPPYHLEWIPWMREPAFAFGKHLTVLVYDVALVNPSYLAWLIDKRSPAFPAHVVDTAKAALLLSAQDDRESFKRWCADAFARFGNQPAEVYASPKFDAFRAAALEAPPTPPAPPAPMRLPSVDVRRFALLDIPDEPAPPAPSPKKRK